MVYGAGSGAAPAGAGSSDAVARAVAALRAAAASGRLLAAGRAATGTVGNGAAAAAQQQQQQQQQLAAPVGLVIDGAALALALQPAHEGEFLDLCRSCAAVVCCRVSPMQKAQVARLLKRCAGAVTLAIGDGANDVSMIQAAHIGVGISGREGRAAVQAADFAFGQFRFLLRLLLVHGRQSYLRCREVVLYAFYKNAAYVSCFVFFTLYSGFSAQSLFFSVYIATFNAIWASLPTIAFGICEQDVSCAAAMANPQLYSETRTQTRGDFVRAWLLWISLGLWHGVCAFFIPLHAMATPNRAGATASVYLLGTAVMTSVIVIVTLRVAIRTQYWTALNHATVWASLALWVPFLAVLGSMCASTPGLAPLCGLGAGLLGTPVFWAGAVLAAPAAALLADFTLMVFQRALAPRPSQILQTKP
ncbi:phospholipid-translocating ATPase [Monoraphidium neglectum]|uniref:Phospholipid-translocating ATPase n=1 Tax=Monoraphidium neglectum TaxID=145388 RepID=A0A0D2JD71_9CHLO|nr:phospholipid-translocating ATPase [Monoraphidium neglectum]KIY97562.1 phospholipid-translocating ATPase [Monoraphidium neglectum]|eukprot:XP_013896582.1 phospholipid-translocating ATPase [Monoraphidium neglectum]